MSVTECLTGTTYGRKDLFGCMISVCHTEEVMVEVMAAGAAEKTRKQKEETWRQGQMITFKPSPSDL